MQKTINKTIAKRNKLLRKESKLRMRKKVTKNIEWSILLCTILLVIIGLFAIYSATANAGHDEFKKQLMWIGVSIPVLIVFTLLDYDMLSKISPILYVLAICTLVAVLFTKPISGATSWFVIKDVISIQPSEFSKIAVILFLGLIISRMKKKGTKEVNRITRLILLFILIGIPLVLIVKQPDYGTAIAFLLAFVCMLFVAGIYKRYIITAILAIIITVPLLYAFVLPEHAKKRIDVFLNPELDPRGAGYNLTQSKLAIGAGELLGMGYLKGNQTQLGFLYPKSTDFIFSVIGEELGFVVASAIIILYVILITKAMYVAKTAKDDLRCTYCNRNSRYIYISYDRKYWNDNRFVTNNRCATSICKLWWKLNVKQLYYDCIVIEY